MSNPYESPKTAVSLAEPLETPSPVGWLAIIPLGALTLGNQTAIFWGFMGFEFWWFPWYLPLFGRLSLISLVISATLTAVVAGLVRLKTQGHLWLSLTLLGTVAPAFIVGLFFLMLRYVAQKGDLLIPIASLLVLCQSIILGSVSYRYFRRWFVFVACGIVCCASGVVLGIYQIIVCSLVT